MKRRGWLARNALGLWFLAIAALGFMRWWMKVAREDAAAFAPDVAQWLAGSIAMANTGQPGSTGSQFFICSEDTKLPASYTLLGKITTGLDLVTARIRIPAVPAAG